MDGEGTALAGDAGNGETPIVAFDNFLRDIQTQADAAAGANLLVNLRDTVEAFKDVRELFGWNTDALVGHGNQRLVALAFQLDQHRRVCLRVFARVGKQIEHDLADALAINQGGKLP